MRVLRCPGCGRGELFETLLRMRRSCPDCGLRFEREPGYFVGAMFVSYALALGAAAPLGAAGLLLGWGLERTLLACAAELAVLSPWLFRLGRGIWIHLDRWMDP